MFAPVFILACIYIYYFGPQKPCTVKYASAEFREIIRANLRAKLIRLKLDMASAIGETTRRAPDVSNSKYSRALAESARFIFVTPVNAIPRGNPRSGENNILGPCAREIMRTETSREGRVILILHRFFGNTHAPQLSVYTTDPSTRFFFFFFVFFTKCEANGYRVVSGPSDV